MNEAIQSNGQSNFKYHAIRVYRYDVKENRPRFVRMLSPDYKGIFTHYYQKRSLYCIGEGCRVQNHNIDRTWKGYVAAELLDLGEKGIWFPIALEITENLELDLRGVYQRGQLWEIYAQDLGKPRKNPPITAKLHADAAPDNLRKPFDIVPCLRALYHRDVVDLKHPSPLPARVYVEETESPLPEVLQREKSERADPSFSFAEEAARRAKAAAQEKKSPAEKKKERGY